MEKNVQELSYDYLDEIVGKCSPYFFEKRKPFIFQKRKK
ncbi:MAG: hypothetical protein BAJALOKI3v1_110082 [Promethearchaeota archaeon]|nr:MAG: hypothetical protein BAJALOKI3v1_110082 [Candidatus Lokiarchaeota archaeon]